MPSTGITRPSTDEHAAYYSTYIDLLPGDDALPPLRS